MTALREITTTQLLLKLEQSLDLETLDLSRVDFRKVDMHHKELRDRFMTITDHVAHQRGEPPYCVDMTLANISGRDFSEFNLSRVIMTGIIAEHTIFAGADLSDVQLDDATLDYADFRYTKLKFTKFYHASLHGTNFTGSDLSSAYGLRLRNPGKDTVDRLGVVSSLMDATLPPEAEEFRQKIQKKIESHHPRKKKVLPKVKRKTEESW